MKSTINFKDIFENYNSNLLNVLRGFGENKEFEFLKFWVPEENKFKSLINLLIVISEQNILKISFIVNKKFVKDEKFFFDQILNKNFFSLNILSNNENYILECENIAENDIKLLQKIFFDNNQTIKFKSNIKKIKNFNKAGYNPETKLSSIEKSKDFICFKEARNFCVESVNQVSSNLNQVRIIENTENFKFLFLINKYNFIIDYCCYEKYTDSNLEKYINLFFSKIIGENIIEARDHGVLKIEDEIFEKESLNGVRIPQFLFSEISYLKKIIQKIYQKLEFKGNDKINKFYRSVSNNWKKKEDNEKAELISKEIKKFMKYLNINFNFKLRNIEDDHKIYLNIELDKKNENLKSSIFFELEKFLKKNIEFTLEIFNIEKIDENKLRLKNSPQA